jgi:hypothetical protein
MGSYAVEISKKRRLQLLQRATSVGHTSGSGPGSQAEIRPCPTLGLLPSAPLPNADIPTVCQYLPSQIQDSGAVLELTFTRTREANAYRTSDQERAKSRKCRPALSSVSMIQTSGSKRISLARRSSTDCSGIGSGEAGVKTRSAGRLSS